MPLTLPICRLPINQDTWSKNVFTTKAFLIRATEARLILFLDSRRSGLAVNPRLSNLSVWLFSSSTSDLRVRLRQAWTSLSSSHDARPQASFDMSNTSAGPAAPGDVPARETVSGAFEPP
jgi:hypothetical protein